MSKVQAFMAKKIAAGTNNNCTLENAAVRREWYVFNTEIACNCSRHSQSSQE